METARPPAGWTEDEPDVNYLSLLVCGSDPQDGALVPGEAVGSMWGAPAH